MKRVLVMAALAVALPAQMITGIKVPKKDHVVFSPLEQTIAANKPAVLTLQFGVDAGFHINSHTPSSETLVATKLAVDDDPAFKVRTVSFPAGVEYSFSFSPKEKLNVYTNDFALTVHVTAKPGAHVLKGALSYQACNSSSCYPPRLLPVELHFTAR